MNIYKVKGGNTETVAAADMKSALKTYTEWVGEEPAEISFLLEVDWIQNDLFELDQAPGAEVAVGG